MAAGPPAVSADGLARKMAAQLVEDEDYQLRYERVAGIDIAKANAEHAFATTASGIFTPAQPRRVARP